MSLSGPANQAPSAELRSHHAMRRIRICRKPPFIARYLALPNAQALAPGLCVPRSGCSVGNARRWRWADSRSSRASSSRLFLPAGSCLHWSGAQPVAPARAMAPGSNCSGTAPDERAQRLQEGFHEGSLTWWSGNAMDRRSRSGMTAIARRAHHPPSMPRAAPVTCNHVVMCRQEVTLSMVRSDAGWILAQ